MLPYQISSEECRQPADDAGACKMHNSRSCLLGLSADDSWLQWSVREKSGSMMFPCYNHIHVMTTRIIMRRLQCTCVRELV